MTDEITALMEKNKNKMILLRLRNDKTIRGTLQEFDSHMNLTLNGAKDVSEQTPVVLGKILLRGDNIMAISLSEESK